MTKWYDSDNPSTLVRSGGWRMAIFIVAAVVFFGLLGWGIWAVSVGTSDIKGKGDAYKAKNDGTNRVLQQERFEDLYNEILAADKNIDVMKEALDLSPDSQVAKTNYSGVKSHCNDVVAEYNANSEKYSAKDFKRVDLPYQIDDTDPRTDCKETIQ